MRIRLRFAKLGKVRWTSHRDVARMWERALRRVELPVAYSGGFSPRPKVSFGLALSTGHESVAEYLDVDLAASEREVDVATLPARLSPALPVGIDVLAAAHIEPRTPSLQEAVTSCTWRIEVPGRSPDELAALVAQALAADELIVTRERKGHEVTDDLRPAILSLEPAGRTARGTELEAELAIQTRSVRPAELLRALETTLPAPCGNGLEEGAVCRTNQWIQTPDGARIEPLPLAPHAAERAS
jgi:radical SAM-linked protein